MPNAGDRLELIDTPSELARQQKRSFTLVTTTFVVLLLLSIAASWGAIELVDATRAYSRGEGLYSKGQKVAVLMLHRYAASQSEEDYQRFLVAIGVPRGDHDARAAMEKVPRDVAAARDGFTRGGNHPDDIGGMIRLFQLSKNWGPFALAVADWREGDERVAELSQIGEDMHKKISDGGLAAATRDKMLADADRLDDRLTELEYTFSNHQGEAARTAANLVVIGVGSFTILLWVFGMVFGRRLLGRQLTLAAAEAAQLASANERLRVTARELEEASAKAEKASSAKTDFLANMSHELRTPLNSILGFAQLLELNAKDPLNPRQKRQVVQIRKSGDHLLALIDDILDLGRIETGKISLSMEPVKLQPVLEQVHAALTPLAEKANIAISFELADDGLIARADRTRLLQVLMNLGNNALKYNRAGGSLIMSAKFDEDGQIELKVKDTGHGIPLERQKEVFEAFNRLGAEQSAIEGSGIGLHITQRLVHLMGGHIGFDSKPQIGTTFTVKLPSWSGEAAAARDPRFPNIVDLRQVKKGYTLLYVEDNPSNFELMQDLVENMDGVKLLTAAHPAVGIVLAETQAPDIIVLDIDLPEMSGFEVLAKLQTNPDTAEIPVMALSAAAMPQDVERGLKAGFTHYLTKPINVREFIAAVEGVMTEHARDRKHP